MSSSISSASESNSTSDSASDSICGPQSELIPVPSLISISRSASRSKYVSKLNLQLAFRLESGLLRGGEHRFRLAIAC